MPRTLFKESMPTERELPVFTQHYSRNRDLEGMNFPVFEEAHLVVGQASFIRFHQDLNEISLKMIHLILFWFLTYLWNFLTCFLDLTKSFLGVYNLTIPVIKNQSASPSATNKWTNGLVYLLSCFLLFWTKACQKTLRHW